MATDKTDQQPDQTLSFLATKKTQRETSAKSSISAREVLAPLSYEGELFPAPQKTSLCSIVFVHYWGGSKAALRRHIRLVNDLGFDAYAFQLFHYSIPPSTSPVSPSRKFGIKHVYADQITRILNEIPGQKIVYAFSNPAGSAIEAIANRKAVDIAGLIIDSGPACDLRKSYDRLLELRYHVRSRAKRWFLVKTTTLFWSPKYHSDVRTDLETLPKDFRLLSLQGWQDEIAPPSDIEQNFDSAPQLKRTRKILPRAGHLDGIRQEAKTYKAAVAEFLRYFR